MDTNSAASAIVTYNNKVLLLLRDDIPSISSPDKWDLPGGHIKSEEPPIDGVKRELKEEIGFVPKNIKKLGSKTGKDNKNRVLYLVRLSKEESENIELGREGQKLQWFSLDETKDLALAKGFVNYINKHQKHINSILKGEKVNPKMIGLKNTKSVK